MSKTFRNLDCLAIASALVVSAALLAADAGAATIGVSFDGSTNVGSPNFPMDQLAGAPGVRAANWNPWYKGDFILGDEGQAVLDDAGNTVAGFTATYTGQDRWGQRGAPVLMNDPQMMKNIMDVFGGVRTVDVVGVPYSTYDLYVYMYDDTDGRAGKFTVGGTTYYARGISPSGSEGAGNPAADGTGYLLSTDTTEGTASDIDQGNYVVFRGLSGADFTLELEAINAGNLDRNKVAGFQIVEAVPEPTAMGLAFLCGTGVFWRRRR